MDINVGIVEDIEEHEKICDVGSGLNDDSEARSRRQTSQMRRIVTVKAIVIKDKISVNPSYTSCGGGVYFPMSSPFFFIYLCLHENF